jgi:hypothetical protein
VDYVEINDPALGLAAYGARLPDAAWPLAGLRRRPADGPTAPYWRVSLRLFLAGLGSVAFTAQLLHPGSNAGEVVSSAAVAQLLHAGFDGRKIVASPGSVHGVSSHVYRCFDAGDRAGGGRSGRNF